jgi:uncharacterized protein (DUF427 family)
LKAIWNDKVIAESSDTVVVEGNHYFPVACIKEEYFVDSSKTTSCPWKGTAHYRSLIIGDETNDNAAWYYPTPKPAAKDTEGRMAFWRGVQIVD